MRRLLAALSMTIALSACGLSHTGGGYYRDDGPHLRPQVDVAHVPDAIPRHEPPSKNGNRPYKVFGKMYYPARERGGYRERGIASWYGKKFHGKRTSSGEYYDMYAMTAAHKTLLLPTYVRVRNLENGKSVVVRVNDRGPFLHNRLIDLSYAAAARIGILETGTGLVEVTSLDMTQAEEQAPAAGPPEEYPASGVDTGPSTPKLYLQVGAFVEWDNAIRVRTQLERARIRPILVQSTLLNETRYYRVRIGPLPSVEESDRMAERMAEYGITDAHVVIE